jgi:hypothetical protein
MKIGHIRPFGIVVFYRGRRRKGRDSCRLLASLLQVGKAVLPRYRSRFSKHQFNQPQLLAILCRMR